MEQHSNVNPDTVDLTFIKNIERLTINVLNRYFSNWKLPFYPDFRELVYYPNYGIIQIDFNLAIHTNIYDNQITIFTCNYTHNFLISTNPISNLDLINITTIIQSELISMVMSWITTNNIAMIDLFIKDSDKHHARWNRVKLNHRNATLKTK